MYSPKSIRPHAVIIEKNRGEDDQGNRIVKTTNIPFCRVKMGLIPKITKNTRVMERTLLVTIDASDAPKEANESTYGDVVIFNNMHFRINEIKYIYDPIKGNVSFIELSCIAI